MLRDVVAAEDATQEAFARLADAEITEIRDVRGWLIVVTSRICLDQMGCDYHCAGPGGRSGWRRCPT